MFPRLSRWLVAVALTGCAATAAPVVGIPQQRDDYVWLDRHEEVLARHREVKPEIVFFGDSITHHFGGEPLAPRHRVAPEVWARLTAGHPASNLGFGFDYIENALWRVEHGELDGIAPKVVVVLLGTNNLGHRHDTPQACETAMKAFLAAVRAKQPKAKILLLGILPRQETALAGPIAATNARYAKLAGGPVTFLDVSAALAVAATGHTAPQSAGRLASPSLFTDTVHPNAAGYTAYAESMRPTLMKLLDAR